MKSSQLRRYVVVEGEYDRFVEWWKAVMPDLRRHAGFTIDFAYGLPDTNEFVWAVSVEGDREHFDAVEAAYIASPERAEAMRGLFERVLEQRVGPVEIFEGCA